MTRARHLVGRGRNELLSSKTGVHSHHQQQIEIVEHFAHGGERRAWIHRRPRRATNFADLRELPLKMRRCLDVYGEAIRSRTGERLEIFFRLFYHHVDVEGQRRELPNRGDHLFAKGDVRNEPSIHYVEMNHVGTASYAHRDFVGKAREIGAEYRGSDSRPHRPMFQRRLVPGARTTVPVSIFGSDGGGGNVEIRRSTCPPAPIT